MRESILWTALKFRAVYFFDKNAYGGIKKVSPCFYRLTATTKRWKLTECDHSIKVRLAKVKEQLKEPTVTEGKSAEPTAKERGYEIMKLHAFSAMWHSSDKTLSAIAAFPPAACDFF